jgi:hypothetical protein
MTKENDLVLIYFEETPLFFARVENILPDSKPGWYHVKLLFLQIPPQQVTWILREAYIDGESFTMNGNRIRLEKVESPEDQIHDEIADTGSADVESLEQVEKSESGKIISLKDIKKS